MHAVILAGGKGSRLRPFTFTIPKPLVPIGDVPIIEILIRQLAAQGFTRATVSVGHLASLIRGFCGDGESWGIPIDYVYEDEPLGTVGSLALLEKFDDDRVAVINGDTLTDMSFADAYRSHSTGDAATICANRRSVSIDFGVLEIDDDDSLIGYSEKPTLDYLVSMGTNILTVDAVRRHLKAGERLDIPGLVDRFRSENERVRVFHPDAYWLDLGRLDDLETGTQVFLANPERFLQP
jgi:NDP-sugar pyrophosphorylase family protein